MSVPSDAIASPAMTVNALAEVTVTALMIWMPPDVEPIEIATLPVPTTVVASRKIQRVRMNLPDPVGDGTL